MEGLRARQMELLREIDRCCGENGMEYILSWHSVLSAVQKGDLPERITLPTIAMRYPDALRLAALMERPGLHFESAFVNRGIPKMVLRCCDTATSCVNVSEINAFTCFGIGIDIELIRPVPRRGIFNKLFILAEDVCILAANLRGSSRLWRTVLGIVSPLERLFLRRIYSAAPSSRLRISRFPKKSVEFPAAFLSETAPLTVRGESFPAPAQLEKYLRIEFGDGWARGDHQKAVEDLHLSVFDVKTPYGETVELLRSIGGGSASVPWVRWFWLRGRMRFLRKYIEGNWDLLLSTGERFSLWKEYMPRKDELLELQRQGKDGELRSQLSRYFASLARYHEKGIVLCFDEEIFRMALALLRAEGKGSYADALEKGVIPAHLQPIKIEVTDDE